MKEFYKTKARRYQFILDAVDKKISNEVLSESLDPFNKTIFFPEFKKKVEELAEIRELVTSELEFCWSQIRRLEEEEKAKKQVEGAEEADETEEAETGEEADQ